MGTSSVAMAIVARAMRAFTLPYARGCALLHVVACHEVDTTCSCVAGLCHFKTRHPGTASGAGRIGYRKHWVCNEVFELRYVLMLQTFARKLRVRRPPCVAIPCSRSFFQTHPYQGRKKGVSTGNLFRDPCHKCNSERCCCCCPCKSVVVELRGRAVCLTYWVSRLACDRKSLFLQSF